MAKRVFKRDDGSSVVTRQSLVNYYILKYFNLFMNAYKFTGIDYQQKDFLLRKMWAVGRLACFRLADKTEKHPQGEVVFCPYATSELNIYDYPVKVSLIKLKNVSFIPTTLQVVDKDVVIGYAQRNKHSVLEMVLPLVEKIVDVEMTLRTSLKSQKTPWLVGYSPENETQRQEIKNNLESDEPYLFLEMDDINQFKAIVSGANYNCDKLYNLKQCYENEIKEYLGINNLGVNEKKEHLIGAEVDVNQEIVESHGECFLDCLKEFCERIKDVLGYEVNVELNKPDSLEYNEVKEEEDDVKTLEQK